MKATWEQQISLFPGSDHVRERIGPPSSHETGSVSERFKGLDYAKAIQSDVFDLPGTTAREGYYGDRHFEYWLSGLQDSTDLLRICTEFGVKKKPARYLDLGGASGRVARHMALAHAIPECIIADINREHVNFVAAALADKVKAFQCSSIPHLPLEDGSFDLISAYSVFSHIETFDDTWIVELRRLLRKGGILALTANIDNFHRVDATWPVFSAIERHPDFDKALLGKELPMDRLVVRWSTEGSYSSIVFVSKKYVLSRWANWFSDVKIVHGLLPFQTMLLLKR